MTRGDDLAGDVLAAPFRLGSHTLRNRVVMLPMGTRYAVDGVLTEEDVEWHRRRARGGVAAVVAGGTIVHDTSRLRTRDAGIIDGFLERGQQMQRRRADVVHGEGALLFGQILHLGRETVGALTELPQLAPSVVRSPRVPAPPHEMDSGDIRRVIRAFATTARMQAEAGLDGVELHAAHGYLIAQFLSAATNRRDDAYGGARQVDRMRFLRNIVEAVRSETPDDFVLGVRLSVDEEDPGGLTVDDSLEIVEALETDGLIDYLSLTVGMRGHYVKDNSLAHGFAFGRIGRVSAHTALPVLAAGRIATPAVARHLISAGIADLAGLGRGLIADPDWTAKALGHVEGDIRPCVGFVQDCRLATAGALCGVNPSAGRELTYGEDTSIAGTVVVVGGGPAGLEAARVAAEAGAHTVLFESQNELGGNGESPRRRRTVQSSPTSLPTSRQSAAAWAWTFGSVQWPTRPQWRQKIPISSSSPQGRRR